MAPQRAWWLGTADMLLRPAARARPPAPPDDPGLRVLHDAYEAAPFTPIGRLGARAEIARRTANAAALRELLDTHPGIAELPVDRPVVVTGLPRTGTTLLHGLLAAHPDARAPLLWELLQPLGDPRRAIRSARRIARFYHAAVPALRTIHPLEPTGPEECVFLLPHSLVHHVRTPVPAYRAWYAGHDPTADYRYLRQQLQALQRHGPPRRWVLKSPFHLTGLDELLTVFPDATVVWTHRDPLPALTSWCSFVEAAMLLQHDRVDPLRIGADWLDIWSAALDRAARTRRTAAGRIVDVGYAELVGEPAATIAKLRDRLGFAPGPPPVVEPCRGSHRYASERYGLDPAEVRRRLTVGPPAPS